MTIRILLFLHLVLVLPKELLPAKRLFSGKKIGITLCLEAVCLCVCVIASIYF